VLTLIVIAYTLCTSGEDTTRWSE